MVVLSLVLDVIPSIHEEMIRWWKYVRSGSKSGKCQNKLCLAYFVYYYTFEKLLKEEAWSGLFVVMKWLNDEMIGNSE